MTLGSDNESSQHKTNFVMNDGALTVNMMCLIKYVSHYVNVSFIVCLANHMEAFPGILYCSSDSVKRLQWIA